MFFGRHFKKAWLESERQNSLLRRDNQKLERELEVLKRKYIRLLNKFNEEGKTCI